MFGSFFVVTKNINAVLNWSTLSEINSSHFIIDHSGDGRSFISIAAISAAGNSSSVRVYSYTHTNPYLYKINYYRLRQVDRDGKSVYSVICNISFENKKKMAVQLNPNAASDVVNVVVKSNDISILMSDMNGKVLGRYQLQQGIHPISIGHLQTGFYELTVYQKQQRIDALRLFKH